MHGIVDYVSTERRVSKDYKFGNIKDGSFLREEEVWVQETIVADIFTIEQNLTLIQYSERIWLLRHGAS